jgi:hypothetical protein
MLSTQRPAIHPPSPSLPPNPPPNPRPADLLGPGLAAFQGPALLAFNDGVFTERDFESISKVGDSKKRGQAGKTGRFGWVAGGGAGGVCLFG